jgi:hypothetical protein
MKRDPKVLKAAYSSIFKGEMGKIVCDDLKTWCHVNHTSFDPKDPHITSFNEGKRFVFLRICQMAKIDLDKVMQQTDNRAVDL